MNKTLKKTGIAILILLMLPVLVNILHPLLTSPAENDRKELLADTVYPSEVTGTERICCIDSNEDALLWRLRMIGSARERIIMSTFDLRTDQSGTDVIAALYDAAERGVLVKILLDGIYQPFFLINDPVFDTFCSHRNIELRFYNPINIKNICHANYRLHDKYLIIDDSMYLLGGRNTHDTFLENYKTNIHIDREILVYEPEQTEGTSLQGLLDYFYSIWDTQRVVAVKPDVKDHVAAENDAILKQRYLQLQEIYPNMETYCGWEMDTYPVERITLLTNGTEPAKKQPAILTALEMLMEDAKNIQIQTPYVICDSAMYAFLSKAAENASVEIIFNAVEKGSNPWGCADYLNNKKKVHNTGVDVYELMNEQPVHTKTMVIDHNISVVGSYNLDMRSTYLDTELMLVIESEQLNAHIRNMNEVYKTKSKAVFSDGSEMTGELYAAEPMGALKNVLYGVLRILIRPVRHLL